MSNADSDNNDSLRLHLSELTAEVADLKENQTKQLRILQTLEFINRTILKAKDIDQMHNRILQAFLDIFSCDRAWLIHPCDPDAQSYRVAMERTVPQWPGAEATGGELPANDLSGQIFTRALNQSEPICFDSTENSNDEIYKDFGIRSQMVMALHPKIGKPWLLGIHHCADACTYSDNDRELFEIIGNRIADGLTSQIDIAERKRVETALRLSEKRLADVAETSYDRMWEMDTDLRFTSVTDQRSAEISPAIKLAVGLTRWELSGVDPDKAPDWQRHRADLLARRPFRNFEYAVNDGEGNKSYWSVSGKPFTDTDGNFAGYRGSSTNITARKQSEERSGWLINAIDELVETLSIYDANDNLTFYNNAFRKHTAKIAHLIRPGLSFEEYLRASVEHGLITDYDDLGEEGWIQERLRRHRACEGPTEIRHSGGHFLTSEHRLDDGGIAAVSIDLSEQKQAEQAARTSRAQVEEIIAIAPEAIITIGEDMKIRLFNLGAERIFGYRAAEVLGEKMEILMPARLRKGHKRHISAFSGSNDTYRLMDNRDEISGLRKDGREFPASASVSTTRTGGETLFTVMLQDVSERRHAERERRRALDAAEKANKAKSEFLATMSHELRTPLNAIIGFSEMLTTQVFGALGNEKYKEYAKDIHTSGSHLLSLVNDILDISAIEAGEHALSKSQIDIKQVVAECKSIVRELARKKNIDFSVKLPGQDYPFEGDARAIRQILLNLLSNAIKFTPAGGKVGLEVISNDDTHVINVTDTGTGIAADKILTLTEPFVRGETDAHLAQEGAGLGLSIVKSLAGLHGGDLAIKSIVGEGTRMRVTLANKS